VRPPQAITRAAAPNAIAAAVKNELRAASPFPPAEIGDDLDLRQDLGLTDDLKRSLASPFQGIARRTNPQATISRDECGDLETVKDAVALVQTKSTPL